MTFDFTSVRIGDVDLALVDRGSGSPIVLLHGSGSTDARTWGPQIDPFAARYRVIAYSRRCHYPNPWVETDTNSTFVQAADLAALVGALDLGRVHVIGSSFGAEIALRFAVEHPELVRTLTVAEPGLATWLVTLPGGETLFADYVRTMRPAKEAVRSGDLERGARLFIDAVLGPGLFAQLPPATLGRIRDNARLIGVEITDIDEVVTDITRADAAAIQAPTLVLTGDASPEMFLTVSGELARCLPNATAVQISGASHLLHGMNPAAFNEVVLAFVAAHDSQWRATVSGD